MKLYRFTASTTQRAISIVHESLGSDALVYSTRRIQDGIEVLAGLPFNAGDEEEFSEDEINDTIVKKKSKAKKNMPLSKIKVENTILDQKSVELVKSEIQAMNENLRILSENISMMHEMLLDALFKKKNNRWNIFKGLKIKIKFRKWELWTKSN